MLVFVRPLSVSEGAAQEHRARRPVTGDKESPTSAPVPSAPCVGGGPAVNTAPDPLRYQRHVHAAAQRLRLFSQAGCAQAPLRGLNYSSSVGCSDTSGHQLYLLAMPTIRATKPKAKKPRTYATGGGNATASGVNFQQSLGALFGLWMLTEAQVDQRLQLGAAKVIVIRMETEAPLDDALALTSDGGVIAAQAKNSLSLSSGLTSEFGKTVDQIVRQWRLSREGAGEYGWNRPLDPAKDRLTIVVGRDSLATIRVHLAQGLEARRQPGKAILTTPETKALKQFDTCVRLAWAAATTDPFTEDILHAISRVTFVLTIDPAGADRAAWIASLGAALIDAADAPSVLNLLERIAGDLMSARGGRTLPALRGDLFGRGARLSARPDYRGDIATLAAYSRQTEQTLCGLEVVEAEAGVPVGITRHCQAAVNAAAFGGNLLLIGEPGAGKSAVINTFGRALRANGHDVVEMAVDRFSVESLEGLSRTLGLRHDLPAVLGAWDGPDPSFLLIDALDASRGGPGEAAFKRLIESVIELGGRWRVIASIRTFDLRLGQSFRALFKGTPPDKALEGEGFAAVRHIQIPPWSPTEFDELLSLSPRLAEVLKHSPPKLRELAMVPFNTRLLADLVARGAVSHDFSAVDSRIALLNLYWEWRVERHGAAAEVCLGVVVGEMVTNRALRALRVKVAAANPAILDTLTAEGVLVPADPQRSSIQFRHHLLFDYVASRVFLDADAIVIGAASFPKAQGLGLVLAPAMGFLLQSLWSEGAAHDRFWTAVSQLLGAADCDPVIRSVAARMAAELPVTAADVEVFAAEINGGNVAGRAALPHVAGAVAVRLEDDPATALAPWVNLELQLSARPAAVASVLRMLGFMLIDRVKDPALRADLGLAVRALLRHGYGLEESRSIATPAIGFVADTIATDREASIALLRETLTDARFDRFGTEELPALAHKISAVAPAASAFAADVYDGVFARQITDDRQTSMGSGRILNLTSNARQDFESARWSLKEYFPKFLAASPVEATRALLAAMTGYLLREHPIPEGLAERRMVVRNVEVRLQPDHSHIWAHEAHPQHAHDADALLSQFESFLETGDEDEVMAAAGYAVQHATLAVVWSRLFMAAAARGGSLGELLVRHAAQPGFVIEPDTRKDAIDLVAAQYLALDEAERTALETQVLNHRFDEFAHPGRAKEALLRNLFSAIGAEDLATERARDVLAQAPAEDRVNPRLFQISSGLIEPDNYHWMNKDVRATPEVGEMIDELERVRDLLHLEIEDQQAPESLDGAIAALTALKSKIDAGTVPDPTLVQRAGGTFAQGVHKLVKSSHVGPATLAETVELILGWIEGACSFTGPPVDHDTERQFEQSLSWGSPSARLEGAEAALDLCLKRPETYARLGPLIDRMLEDPHPAVRMRAALHLIRIWELDREGFWARARRVIEGEENRGVLDCFITKTMGTLVWHGAEREVANLVLPLNQRLPANEPRNATIRTHLVQMTVQFWLRFKFEDAADQVRAWVSASLDNVGEVRQAIQWLRNAFTAGLRGQSDAERPEDRRIAMDLLTETTRQAADEIAGYTDRAKHTEAETARARSAVQILDTASQQLYFNSGAFRDGNDQDKRPAMTVESGAIFLHEVTPILRRIGEHGGPHTVYHLIRLLEYLVESDPAGAFDLIAFAILKGGQQSGYQFEPLAADLMVKLVGRYLADHKAVFNDSKRRSALVDTLETFVAAGWPSVRRLFYRLPELLQ